MSLASNRKGHPVFEFDTVEAGFQSIVPQCTRLCISTVRGGHEEDTVACREMRLRYDMPQSSAILCNFR